MVACDLNGRGFSFLSQVQKCETDSTMRERATKAEGEYGRKKSSLCHRRIGHETLKEGRREGRKAWNNHDLESHMQ